ncbi:TonB-dependent receptor [Sphingomonas sp. VNH70]|uniref:TonB-dependent receptor n=1 Tax=Sphingomonas silueang TaxID=3156617 RepID=UPI0032B39494
MRLSYMHFLKSAGGASALALALLAQGAQAQDTVAPESQTSTATETPTGAPANPSDQPSPAKDDAPAGDEIVVTGIRASLAKAQDIKRDSATVVDAITAEDIGALPDRSVNEALQRVPGVAITRFAAAGDSAHFSVEGSGVVIRGLTFVRGEFNGRDTFSTSGGREIGFNDVAPELVGSVEVFKNLTSDLIEGGIAGTVNINTRKPFDSKKRLVYLSAEMNYADLIEKSAPTFTGLFSNQWELSNGSRVGLLVSGTYSQLYSQAHSAFVSSPFERFNGTRTFNAGTPYASTVTDTFNCGNGLTSCYAPTGAGVRTQDFDRRRYGISAAAQFATAGDELIATAQFLRTNGKNTWVERTIEPNVWYADVNATFPAPGTSYTFDDDRVFVSGNIRRPGSFKEGFIPGSNGQYGRLTNFQSGGIFTTFSNRALSNEAQTDDYSLNFKVTPSDRLRFNFDGQYVKSKLNATDVIIDTGTWSNIFLDTSGKIPQVAFSIGDVPAYNGRTPSAAEYFSNPNSIYFRDAFSDINDNNGEEWAFRADGEYDLSDSGFLRRIRVGGRYADRDQVVRNNGYNNWGAPSETWTGGGAQTFASIDRSLYGVYGFPNFFRGEALAPPNANYLNPDILLDYDRSQNLLRQINRAGQGSYTPLEDRTCQNNAAKVNRFFCPNEVFDNSETTIAGYARLDFAADLGGTSAFDGNIGVRYVNTLERSFGAVTAPLANAVFNPTTNPDTGRPYTLAEFCARAPEPGQQRAGICQLPAADQQRAIAFANGASTPYTGRNRFDHWLPSINLRFKPTEKLQFRLAGSRALSRPNFGNLRAFIGVNPDTNRTGQLVFSARSQNPFLEPVEATQADLTAEWYFNRVGSLTGAVFWKRLTNLIDDNSQSVLNLTNNGATFPILVQGPANVDGSATIKGAEISYQQTYDFLPGALSGLGMQATYTFVDTGSFPNPTPANNAADGNRPPGQVDGLYGALPLQQLSKHNVNVAGFYDKYGLYARLAYSWRSSYLISVRDCCFPFLPVFSEPTGQLDGSLFYTVNDQFKIGVQVQNMLNEITRTSFGLYADEDGEVVRAKRAAFINDRRFSLSVRLTL